MRSQWMRRVGCAAVLLALFAGCEGEGAAGGADLGDSDPDAGLVVDALSDVPEGELDAEDTSPAAPDADQTDESEDVLEMTGDPYALEPPGPVPRFADTRESLFDAPFPNDARRTADGVDLQGWPNPNNADLIGDYILAASAVVGGFSATGPAWFTFDRPLNATLLPTPAQSTSNASPIWLIDATEGSETFGHRFPFEAAFHATGGVGYLPDNTLCLRPLPGWPLREGGTYAWVVRRKLRGLDGNAITPPEALVAALSAESAPGSSPWVQVFAPLRLVVEAELLNPYEVGVATVYTVDRYTDDLVKARQVIRQGSAPEVGEWRVLKEKNEYVLYEGLYSAPNFQTGEKPYNQTGGGFLVDAGGAPQPTSLESLRMALAVPTGEPPPSGWPLVFYGHGTGGNYTTFTVEGPQSPAKRLTSLGLAVVSIDQPLHGIRYDGPEDPEITSFNFLNPEAGRTNFRQSALDYMVLVHLFQAGVVVPAASAHTGVDILFDTSRMGYLGHSHGGLAGAMLAAVEPDLPGVVLSGAGGGLQETLMLRKDPVDFRELVTLLSGEVSSEWVTPMHPTMALVQLLVDITDPVNYAPYLLSGALRGGKPVSLLITEGTLDAYTPAITTESLASAALVPPLAPVVSMSDGYALRDFEPIQKPTIGNALSDSGLPATAGLVQSNEHGHFLIFDDEDVAGLYSRFLRTSANSIAKIQ